MALVIANFQRSAWVEEDSAIVPALSAHDGDNRFRHSHCQMQSRTWEASARELMALRRRSDVAISTFSNRPVPETYSFPKTNA